jgi:hypothetical protein
MRPDQGRPIVHLPGEGRVFNLGAFGMSVEADASDTGGSPSLLEAAEPPGFGPPMHTHEDAGEAFYVLEGECLMFVEDHGVSVPCRILCVRSGALGSRVRRRKDPERKLNAGARSGTRGLLLI